MAGNTLYDTDLYAWTRAQAELLRARRFDEIDADHLAEEIEAVGASDRREMRRRLARLIQHLLKYDYHIELRSRSWRATISAQRAAFADLLENNATLRSQLPEMLQGAYRLGREWALEETGLFDLPEHCPYTLEHIQGGELSPLG
jgi:hypothetical protein